MGQSVVQMRRSPHRIEKGHRLRNMRSLILLTLAWAVVAIVIPGLLTYGTEDSAVWLRSAANLVGLVLLAVTSVVVLCEIRKGKYIIHLAVLGIFLLFVALICRTAFVLEPSGSFSAEELRSFAGRFSNASHALGLLSMAAALLYAVVGLLEARMSLVAELKAANEQLRWHGDMETSLREREAMLTAMGASALDAVIMMDHEGYICYWNPAAKRILGYGENEVFLKGLHDLLAPSEYRMAFTEGMARWRATGQGALFGKTVELKAKRKDGSIVDVEVTVTAVDVLQRRYAMGVLRDITARRREELEVLQEKQEIVDLFDNLPVAAYRCSPGSDGRMLEVNLACLALFGARSKDEVLGRTLTERFRKASAFRRICDTLSRNGLAKSEEVELVDLQGGSFWTSVNAVMRHTRSGSVYVEGTLEDISERKNTEIALRESEAKYLELVQSASSLLLRVNPEGRITFVNEFGLEFLGYREDELVGRSLLDSILSDSEGVRRTLQELREHPDRCVECENENSLKNGGKAWIAWTYKPICDACGEISEVLCIGNDVTARVNAERTVQEQQTRMMNGSRLSAVGAMAGSIAHEINGPLAVVAAAAEQLPGLLNGNVDDQEEYLKGLCSAITRQVNRVSRIVRSLRALVRNDTSDTFVEAHVKDIVEDTVDLCRDRLSKSRIELQLQPVDPEIKCECSPTQISQVLLNLLNNACDAVMPLDAKWIRVEAWKEQEMVLLAVTDSGRGIAPENRDKLFLSFFTTKDSGRGVGLGLSISARIAEVHHGSLCLDDESPNTRFVLQLPARQKTLRQPVASDTEETGPSAFVASQGSDRRDGWLY